MMILAFGLGMIWKKTGAKTELHGEYKQVRISLLFSTVHLRLDSPNFFLYVIFSLFHQMLHLIIVYSNCATNNFIFQTAILGMKNVFGL